MKNSKNISRKEAFKKMGFGALTASTMITLLSAPQAKAGNWDDINRANGFATPLAAAEPGASPQEGGVYDLGVSVTGSVDKKGNYAITVVVINNGSNKLSNVTVEVLDGSVLLGSKLIRNIQSNNSSSLSFNLAGAVNPVTVVLSMTGQSLSGDYSVVYI